MKKKPDDPNNMCACPSCFEKMKIKDIEAHYKEDHFAPEEHSGEEHNPCEHCDNSYGDEECDGCDDYSG